MFRPDGQCDPVPNRGRWGGILYDRIPRFFCTRRAHFGGGGPVGEYPMEGGFGNPLHSVRRTL